MAAGVPVIALDAGAVAETMGGAGVLLQDDRPELVSAVAHTVLSDHHLRDRLVADQDTRLTRLEAFDVGCFLDAVLRHASGSARRRTVQVQGPFETSYSLAVLNRELALALDETTGFDVSIYATEGPGDYTPREEDLLRHPRARELWEKASGALYPDVVIRQMYPPRVHDSTGGLTLQYFGWEESRLPDEYVQDFNRYVDAIGTMSSYVVDVLRDSGVAVPISVVGVGVHPPDTAARNCAPELENLRSTRFLHISSAFPRKGIDVLLAAYAEAFDESDDVTLILKTFPNPHNVVGELLTRLRERNDRLPDIRWIDRDMDRNEIDALYDLASAYVQPSRGEGFGLPVAEAMLARVPVIAVGATGMADFVSDRTAAVIGHRTEPAATHLTVHGSMWVEPNRCDLARELRSVADGDWNDLRQQRVDEAHRLISSEYTWTRVAERWAEFIGGLHARIRPIRVASVTTFNSRCGIAEYTADLSTAMNGLVQMEMLADRDAVPLDERAEEGVRRVWWNHLQGPVDELLEELDRSQADLVHIQYNYGFFRLGELARLVRHEAVRRPVVVTLHRTSDLDLPGDTVRIDTVADELRLADAIVVHQAQDVERLARAGLSANVHLIPIGSAPFVPTDVGAARRRHRLPAGGLLVGTFGFLLPHKGTLTLIRAVAQLRDRGVPAHLVAVCALHPDPSSATYLERCRAEIDRLGLAGAVDLFTDYLDERMARELLSATDMIALPYEFTKESSSAALRFVLATGRPVVTSDLEIFEDASEAVLRLPTPVDPAELARRLEELWLDDAQAARLAALSQEYSRSSSWQLVAARTVELYDRTIARRRTPPSPRADSRNP
jgi:glycosyltransferase involved in cell wall biosynthesis